MPRPRKCFEIPQYVRITGSYAIDVDPTVNFPVSATEIEICHVAVLDVSVRKPVLRFYTIAIGSGSRISHDINRSLKMVEDYLCGNNVRIL